MNRNGVLNVYKEAGYTSHDVVARLRGILHQKKIGHTGTLDPAAVGVLPVCLGSATRLCGMLTDWNKEYVADCLLGVSTDTQDMTGRLLRRQPVAVDAAQAEAAVYSFQGTYLQVPPMYSALKVNGKKLYELARAGKEVERTPRPVTIEEIEVLETALPRIRFRTVCSKGTYIRTLCADIGEKLGCGGTMEHLERTRVGMFRLEDALSLKDIEEAEQAGTLEKKLLPVDAVFDAYAKLHVQDCWKRLIENGNAFAPEQTAEGKTLKEDPVRVYDEEGRFYGLFLYSEAENRYRPCKMFLEQG